ncbi:MAG: hypothetical protein GX628_11155 [Clostridiales bacterium]|nr:hypothetical protein [Clostridiales bacterium]
MNEKRFEFASGLVCTFSVDEQFRFVVSDGAGRSLTLRGWGALSISPCIALGVTASAALPSGRISAEEEENAVTLHFNPSDSGGAPLPALMLHYRVEKAGENALRISAYIGSREPRVGNINFLTLAPEGAVPAAMRGFGPEYSITPAEMGHNLRFDLGAAMCFEGGEADGMYAMLSGCGRARMIPAADGDAPSYRLGAAGGDAANTDLSQFDEAHPFTALLSFGVGEPSLPEAAPLCLPDQPLIYGADFDGSYGKAAALTSGRLTAAVYYLGDGVLLAPTSLDGFSPAGKGCRCELSRITLRKRDTGELCVLSSRRGWGDVRVLKTCSELTVTLAKPHNGIRLSLTVEARAVEPDRIEWRTRISNDDPDWSVFEVSYPDIGFSGGENFSPALLLPAESGTLVRDAYKRQMKWYGSYPSGFNGTFPVFGIYSEDKPGTPGIYAGIHAPAAAMVALTAALFESGEGVFAFSYPAENLGRGANSFALNGVLVQQAVDGGWYGMADIYRDYVLNHAEWVRPTGRSDSPAWMREVPMYVMDWMPNDNPDADPIPVSVRPPKPQPRDNWVTAPARLADKLGLPIGYHLYNWHFIPFNNDYPWYFPVKEGLAEGVKELHRHGVHVMPYINGRIADTRNCRDAAGETVRFDRMFKAGATKRFNGSMFTETYASHEPDGKLCVLAAICPTCPEWRSVMADTVRRLFDEYDMDAVYVDQIAAARMNLCCDENHNHTPGNGRWWPRAYRGMMDELRRIAPEGKGFTTECNADCYSDMFDGFLTWSWVTPDLVPFFPRVYAGRIAMLGRNTNGYKKPDAVYFRFHTAQAVMFGQQIGWTNADVVDDERKSDFLVRMCRLRWDTREYYISGEMLRPPAVEGGEDYTSDSSMGRENMQTVSLAVASAWRGADGNVIVTAANASEHEAEVTLRFDPDEYPLPEGLTVYGEAAELCRGEGYVTLKIGGMSAVCFG